jgi:hypothetical protein
MLTKQDAQPKSLFPIYFSTSHNREKHHGTVVARRSMWWLPLMPASPAAPLEHTAHPLAGDDLQGTPPAASRASHEGWRELCEGVGQPGNAGIEAEQLQTSGDQQLGSPLAA